MAGPVPKPAEQRARRNKPPAPVLVLEVTTTEQPDLADLYEFVIDGVKRPWPEATLRWWESWGASPLTADFPSTDWDEFAITASLHGRIMLGQTACFPEYRLRMAKFGATPEDRARLRISLVAADEAEEKAGSRKSSPSKSRYSGMKLAK